MSPGPDQAGQLADLHARLARVEDDLRAALDAVYEPPPIPADSAEPVVEPAFTTLEAWVVEHFVKLYARPIGAQWRWCAAWWAHAEALSRLEALWRSWETLRQDPRLGIATWYRDHLDPQLPVLLGPTGPFARCTPDRHTNPGPLSVRPAPEHYWDDAPVLPVDNQTGAAGLVAPVGPGQ